MTKQSDRPAYRLTIDATLARHDTSLSGLKDSQAAARLRDEGPNALSDLKSEPLFFRYLRQFQDWMIILLLVSGSIAAYLGDAGTALVLLVLVIFNTTIGFFQEYRAEKIMQALEKLVQPMAEVYRNGTLTEVESRLLVVGDIVRLTEGDSVPADVRLTELTSFATNDFALTGESNPTRKFTHAITGEVSVASRHNLAYMGTTVAIGEAYGVVVATGMQTELGRIANLSLAAPHTPSPLQLELRHIATYVTYGVAVLSSILLIIAIKINLPFKEALLFAVGFASSLIPQGLPAEVNTSLAQAAGKLSRAKALVKKLSAVETLGATEIICTDKTGTLTKNEMTVVSAYVGGAMYELTGTGYEPRGVIAKEGGSPLSKAEQGRLRDFFEVGLMASNARIIAPDETSQKWRCLGDPTEGALVVAAQKAGLSTDSEAARAHEIRELPFDSARKRMTSLRQFSTGVVTAFVKGAPEAILERSTHIQDGDIVRPITDKDKKAFLAEHAKRAEKALRNLAFATRAVPEKTAIKGEIDTIETGLTLVGLVSMIDPLRETVPEAMAAAHRAHIKVNIVTGDFAITAEAIARQAGLAKDGDLKVITGEQLTAMSDNDLLIEALQGGRIFSRVSPEDKMRIVSLIKSHGHVIAVTGDGINDAPALKRADIGVAMGITGTDVAKQSSEIILLDDSFSTLVQAVREGRTIFANIKKAVLSCFTSNLAELVVNVGSLILAAVIGAPLAINVLQILAIDLLAELFPIAALGWDKEEGETMKQKPRDPKAHILNLKSILDLVWCGIVIGGLALVNYLLFYERNGFAPADAPQQLIYQATTITYTTIVLCQLVNIIQRRSIYGFFSRYQLSNRHFWIAIIGSLAVVASIAYIPFVSSFFKSGPIGPVDWLFVVAAAAIFLAIRETQRLLRRKA